MICKHLFTALSLVAALAVAGCSGDDGAPGASGNDGLGFIPTPEADQFLGDYDPTGDPVGQEVAEQVGQNSGVWEITLDHQVQINGLGDALNERDAPVLASRVIYDADHDDLWLTVNGVDIPLSENQSAYDVNLFDVAESLACDGAGGVPQPCVVWEDEARQSYARLVSVDIEDDPDTNTRVYAVYGVMTAVADMPATGSASYSGFGDITAEITPADGFGTYPTFQSSVVDVTADFGLGEVTFNQFGGIGNNSHDIDGVATIDGNSYTGTVDGVIIGRIADDANTLNITGTTEGSFYGPAANTGLDGDFFGEIAGVWQAGDSDPDLDVDDFPTSGIGEAIGGFVADQDVPLIIAK